MYTATSSDQSLDFRHSASFTHVPREFKSPGAKRTDVRSHSLLRAERNLKGSFSAQVSSWWALPLLWCNTSALSGCDGAISLGLKLEDQRHPVANEKVDHDLEVRLTRTECAVLQKYQAFGPKTAWLFEPDTCRLAGKERRSMVPRMGETLKK